MINIKDFTRGNWASSMSYMKRIAKNYDSDNRRNTWNISAGCRKCKPVFVDPVVTSKIKLAHATAQPQKRIKIEYGRQTDEKPIQSEMSVVSPSGFRSFDNGQITRCQVGHE
jgi:hypothetical protein